MIYYIVKEKGGLLIYLQTMLEQKNITKYHLSKISGAPKLRSLTFIPVRARLIVAMQRPVIK